MTDLPVWFSQLTVSDLPPRFLYSRLGLDHFVILFAVLLILFLITLQLFIHRKSLSLPRESPTKPTIHTYSPETTDWLRFFLLSNTNRTIWISLFTCKVDLNQVPRPLQMYNLLKDMKCVRGYQNLIIEKISHFLKVLLFNYLWNNFLLNKITTLHF